MRGIALLWLRIAVSALLIQHAALVWDGTRLALEPLVFGVAAAFLLAGFLTSTSSLFSAALAAYDSIAGGLDSWRLPFLLISILAALAALGPGAYSLDALLFGRKKLTIGRPSP
jgi:hypothetical protein